MKIGVISDTHGYEKRFVQACEKFFDGADLILHAGDVLNHGPNNPNCKGDDYNPKSLANRINNSKIPVIICRGNCDSEVDQMVIEVPIQAPYAYVFANGKRIVVTHGHTVMTDEEKNKMAEHLKADIFITGHIHKNILEKRGNTIFLNPGTISPYLTNNEEKKTSVAVITDEKIEIFDLDTGEILNQFVMKNF